MYNVTDDFKKKVRSNSRKLKWSGSITCTDGTVLSFTRADMPKGSAGKLVRSCSGSSALEIGSVFASELDLELYLQVDRYKLYNAVIDLQCSLVTDTIWNPTWAALKTYTWGQLSDATWEFRGAELADAIPMGKYKIAEAIQKLQNLISITAYDYMLSFEKKMTVSNETHILYDWLKAWCTACEVTLGMSAVETYKLPNGTRQLGIASGSDTIETYRDALSYLSAACCCVAQINRAGALVLIPYGTDAVDTIPAGWRFHSAFSDFKVYYTGCYATYKNGALSEYYSNTTLTGKDDGLVYEMGVNPFLQITNEANRKAAVQAILDRLAKVCYVPYEVLTPGNPAYDPMDVIKFSGNQAGDADLGAVTELTYQIGGRETLKCVGENPRLIAAKSRFTKTIDGLISGGTVSGSAGGTSYWLLHNESAAEDQAITAKTQTNEISFTSTVDVSRIGIEYTAAYTLDETAEVTAEIQVDGTAVYSATDLQQAGKHVLTVVTGDDASGKQEHNVTVFLTESAVSSSVDTAISSMDTRVTALEAKNGTASA